jgi:L-2-hydroxyglutarate oxidase LhgO
MQEEKQISNEEVVESLSEKSKELTEQIEQTGTAFSKAAESVDNFVKVQGIEGAIINRDGTKKKIVETISKRSKKAKRIARNNIERRKRNGTL